MILPRLRTFLTVSAFAALTALTALMVQAVTPLGASAQTPVGMFVRDTSAGDNLESVVVDALPHVKSVFAKIFKAKAKSRLRQVIVAATWQKFTTFGDSVRLETSSFSGARAMTAPVNGVVKGWKRYWPNGKPELLDVYVLNTANELHVRYVAKDGERTDVYRLDAGGRLTQDITLRSEQLSSPIHYTLVYKRERSAP